MRARANYLGVSDVFELSAACQLINLAFGADCYLVGSCLEKRDYRDVDIRMIVEDKAFVDIFGVLEPGVHDARFALMNVVISHWLKHRTGLPVDFQFQARSIANEKFKGERQALFM